MVDPDRNPLPESIEIYETSNSHHTGIDTGWPWEGPTWVECGVCCGEHKIVEAVKFEPRGERNCRGRTRISEFPNYTTKYPA